MIKLSKAGKMPCPSWSLIARTHCPASVHLSGPRKGELVDACHGCYAAGGQYRYPNVRNPREHNAKDWKRPEWVSDMVAAIEREPFFRWFDSGDVYTLALARKILAVMRATPNTRHWLPTRMHKLAKFRPVLASMAMLPNVVVRRSSDSVQGAYDKRHATASTIVSSVDQVTDDMVMCSAYNRDGKCGDCRACWDKHVRVIAYPGHGRIMRSLQNRLIQVTEVA